MDTLTQKLAALSSESVDRVEIKWRERQGGDIQAINERRCSVEPGGITQKEEAGVGYTQSQ